MLQTLHTCVRRCTKYVGVNFCSSLSLCSLEPYDFPPFVPLSFFQRGPLPVTVAEKKMTERNWRSFCNIWDRFRPRGEETGEGIVCSDGVETESGEVELSWTEGIGEVDFR